MAFTGSRWPWACLAVQVLIGACKESRGRAMGILSACIGTQPAGTLWIGFLSGAIGVPLAMAINGMAALLAMLPAAWPLAWRGRGRPATRAPRY